MTEQEYQELLMDIRLSLQRINDALFDRDGVEGLCSKVKKLDKQIFAMWIAIAILAASTGLDLFEAIKVLAKGFQMNNTGVSNDKPPSSLDTSAGGVPPSNLVHGQSQHKGGIRPSWTSIFYLRSPRTGRCTLICKSL